MKFGKSLLTLLHAPWADHYLAYKDLKKTLKRQVAGDAQTNSQVEGAFVTELLQSIAACNGFFTRTEQEIAARLAALVAQLEKPASWVTRTVAVAADATGEVSLGSIAASLEVGTHLDQAHFEALGAFVALCADIDALRKYSMLNYLAVTKIVKKHDKQSALRLREGIINFVASQPFYTSTQLARTFTHAQCLASEIIAAATSASILSQVLPPFRPSPAATPPRPPHAPAHHPPPPPPPAERRLQVLHLPRGAQHAGGALVRPPLLLLVLGQVVPVRQPLPAVQEGDRPRPRQLPRAPPPPRAILRRPRNSVPFYGSSSPSARSPL